MTRAEGAAAAWLAAKAEEDAARGRRIAAEDVLVAELGCKPDGSRTEKLEGYKVTLTGQIIRSLDRERWAEVSEQVPADLRPVKIVEQVDDAGCRWLAEHDPKTWAICAQAITSRPAKVGVKVSLREGE